MRIKEAKNRLGGDPAIQIEWFRSQLTANVHQNLQNRKHMTDTTDPNDLDLSDEELIEVLKNHGLDRRLLLKVFGIGTGVAALGGTASAQGIGNRIDKVYGAPYEANENVPSGLVDHEVNLHIHEPGDHNDFPLNEGGEEGPAEFIFDPVGLHVKPGDVVNFAVHHGLHTVTAIHPKFNEPPMLEFPDRVPNNAFFTSPPINVDDSWLYRFTTKGVYDVMCLPHVSLGMVMRVVVHDEDDAVPSDPYDSFPIPNAADVFEAPELEPSNIVSEGTVAWADLSL